MRWYNTKKNNIIKGFYKKAAKAKIIQITTPAKNFAPMPKIWPNPAPAAVLSERRNCLPEDFSTIKTADAAPRAEPMSVPKTGIGITIVPVIAPRIAPIIAAAIDFLLPPAARAPPALAKNSISSPKNASTTAAIIM